MAMTRATPSSQRRALRTSPRIEMTTKRTIRATAIRHMPITLPGQAG